MDILHIQGKEATNVSKLKLNLFIPLSEVMLELKQWLNWGQGQNQQGIFCDQIAFLSSNTDRFLVQSFPQEWNCVLSYWVIIFGLQIRELGVQKHVQLQTIPGFGFSSLT